MLFKFRILLIFSLVLNSGILLSQINNTPGRTDTLIQTSQDTLTAVDTTDAGSEIDTVIYSSASDSLIFYVKERKMDIYGEGNLEYKDTKLKSAKIYVDFETSDIEAEGVPSDTSDRPVSTPVLSERGETYEGVSMKYNFKTRRGFISAAATETEGAYYIGNKIKKVDEQTFFIEDGIYTTCDRTEPHYHFYSKHMKVIHQEQVVADWIWLNFGGVPFPIPIPFAVFPLQSGRRSGILPPAFGDNAQYGRFFSRFGYFWAISDYMDVNLTADYYTRGSFNLNSRFRYTKRYSFNGQLEGSYLFRKTGESYDPNFSKQKEWRIKWYHNQNINPTLRFDANLEFISGSGYLNRAILDQSQLLRNDIISNATLFKNWDESGNSLSINYSRTQELESGDITETLPNLTFSMSQKYPFRNGNGSGDQNWYELIGYSFNSQFLNRRIKTGGDLNIRGGIQHSFRTSASPKIGYINLTPSFSYQERWFNKRIEISRILSPVTGRDTVVTNDVKEINFVRTFNTGISASTKFYGMFQPNVLGIAAVRHQVNPTVSYNYTPDFSRSFWGYFDNYTDTLGREVKYNKFQREVFGGIGQGEVQSISFAVSNIFEMKTSVDPTDTTSKEKKYQLLNLDARISYNFAADSLNFSDLTLGYRTNFGDWLSFQGNSTFSLYDWNENGREINKFLINEGKGLLRLTNFSFSVSTSLSGEKLRSKETTPVYDELEDDGLGGLGNVAGSEVYKGIYDEKDPDFTIPWDISLSYYYNYNQSAPTVKNIRSSLSGGFNFNLTPNWKLSFSGSYDFKNKEFAAPVVRISRDLHCWTMNFTWNPIGTFRGYYFEIRVKAPQLQDLKLTKQDRFFSGR